MVSPATAAIHTLYLNKLMKSINSPINPLVSGSATLASKIIIKKIENIGALFLMPPSDAISFVFVLSEMISMIKNKPTTFIP